MAHDQLAEHARTAMELDADVGTEQVAAVYAEALLGAAEKQGQTDAVLEQFDSLLFDVFDRFPKLEEILTSQLISSEEKLAIVDRTLGRQAIRLFGNFLKVVAKHGRMDCLRAIWRQCHLQYDRLRGRIPVEVTTAEPVDAAVLERIRQSAARLVSGEPLLRTKVDQRLIGGIVVRVGDTVYDASVATQLHKLRDKIVRRSSHEIQSRRDRFRYPAGN